MLSDVAATAAVAPPSLIYVRRLRLTRARDVSRMTISSFARNCGNETGTFALITYIFSGVLICRTIKCYDYFRFRRSLLFDFLRYLERLDLKKNMFKYVEESIFLSLFFSLYELLDFPRRHAIL